MSLYDGLDIEEKTSNTSSKADVSGWGSSMKMLQTQKQLQEKNKASLLQPRKRSSTTLAPVIDLKRSSDEGDIYFNMMTGKMERRERPAYVEEQSPARGRAHSPSPPPKIGSLSALIGMEPSINLTGVPDEYDPLHPNEYEDFAKKRRDDRRAEDRKKDRESRKARQEREKEERKKELVSRYESDSDDEDQRRSRERRKRDRDDDRPQRGAAIAPPSSILEDVVKPDEEERPHIGSSGGGIGGGSVASKIMARMGYKQGQGLGKKEQGMSTALQVEKTSKRGGKIIHEKDVSKDMPPPDMPSTAPNLMKNPTKVILLLNMVDRGDIDEELEGETAEECSKYGKVNRCIIHEMPDDVAEDLCVRIFVEFDRLESAIKGVIDLNGRFFGGRVVSATFYNLDRFRRLELDDELPPT